ncbi:hypothetical protein CLOBOL_03427 [Enterocloster bolteae ATCC BAA-613]|uniref:Uncharacterized protein n=1 Tax=Enterocloster bolteae (strain ATCC BAA-613 / DSM 15670 / CCUG 46953 / JCM 12243 / WAL 16351) TaxID=411902 RepID=A8RSS8_ENTBW|nr:hypothetical protein CLOBOL_03427 [Enterocloster bolteae ATCC BAA-613]
MIFQTYWNTYQMSQDNEEVKRHLKGKKIPFKCLFIFSLIL